MVKEALRDKTNKRKGVNLMISQYVINKLQLFYGVKERHVILRPNNNNVGMSLFAAIFIIIGRRKGTVCSMNKT